MDTNFVDLDILLTRIRNPRSRIYFLEAVKSYKVGALRSALTSAWVAVVYDLIAKYRELSSMDDAAASAFISKWDKATDEEDTQRLLALEREIIGDAKNNTQVITRLAEIQLERLRDDRHLCAHPAFSTESDLFEPSSELVRLHLVNAITLVLSQEPLQGKAILDEFHADVQTPGFPTEMDKIRSYVASKYLNRIRPSNVNNLGVVLAKSLIKGVPKEWNSHRHKITSSLIVVREISTDSWPDISTKIVNLIDQNPPEFRISSIYFLSEFPDFWNSLQDATQTSLLATVSNIDPNEVTDYNFLSAIRLPDFNREILGLINRLSNDQLSKAIANNPLTELWPAALEAYDDSGTFASSARNFGNLISPFSGRIRSNQLDDLFLAISNNDQNSYAFETPGLLVSMLKNTNHADFPNHEVRNNFYEILSELGGLLRRYEEVIHLLQKDSWVPPTEPLEGANL